MQPTMTITHGIVMGRRPAEYQQYPADDGPFPTAQDLSWDDFVRLTTGQTDFHVPPSVRRIDVARALEEFTLPARCCAMVREAVIVLGVESAVNRNADNRNQPRKTHGKSKKEPHCRTEVGYGGLTVQYRDLL